MKKSGTIKLRNRKSKVFIVVNLSRKSVIPCAEKPRQKVFLPKRE